ncbi:MAG: hypothetical protein DRR42_28065 [Gammaproteobacteria bacterium]|nr:MAG: hypothetical protein DRR42_28065 [Gammaproteobacteria bacterium]
MNFLNALNSAILIVSISLTAEAQEHVLPDAARDVLVRYSSALNRGDCEAMLELASPEIISRLHRFEGGKDGFCEGIRYFHDIGIVDSLGEPLAIKSEGPYRMAMVETIRLAGGAPGFVDARGIYVLHSSDSGKHWWVLDNSCVNYEWMTIVYPPYDGDPPIPGGSETLPER